MNIKEDIKNGYGSRVDKLKIKEVNYERQTKA